MDSNSASAIIIKVDIIKNGQIMQTLTPNLQAYDVNIVDEDVNSPGYYRVKIVSHDTINDEVQFAWTNPVFVNKQLTRTITYDWEDGGTILGSYNDIDANNVSDPEPVFEGQSSLKLIDQASSGTPQAYVAWITNLQDGDEVTVGFWRYDTTPGTGPSCRIWAHYTKDLNNIESWSGSAGGNGDYGPGTGWDYTEHTWTFVDDGENNGLVIEARTYTDPGATAWIDNLTVTAPTHAAVIVPGN
jgi:hypothetical protein